MGLMFRPTMASIKLSRFPFRRVSYDALGSTMNTQDIYAGPLAGLIVCQELRDFGRPQVVMVMLGCLCQI
jgi:hypothetical protein